MSFARASRAFDPARYVLSFFTLVRLAVATPRRPCELGFDPGPGEPARLGTLDPKGVDPEGFASFDME